MFDVGVMTASEITTACLLSFFDRYKIIFGGVDFIFIELINRCNDWQAWLTVQRIVLIVSSVEFASGYGKRSIDKRG